MTLYECSSEDSKQTGGMIALRLRGSDAQNLSIPGGEPPQDLHLTLLFFGNEVDQVISDVIPSVCSYASLNFNSIWANVFSHAEFNPGSEDECAVYLVSGTSELSELRDMIIRELEGKIEIPDQHEPWIPHITASYQHNVSQLFFTGQVCFDRISLDWAGQQQVFPL